MSTTGNFGRSHWTGYESDDIQEVVLGATIIRTFERGKWSLYLCCVEGKSALLGNPRRFRLTCLPRYDIEWLGEFKSPWVHESDLTARKGVFYSADSVIYKPLMREYGRATVGGAIQQARQWQVQQVKDKLKGEPQ